MLATKRHGLANGGRKASPGGKALFMRRKYVLLGENMVMLTVSARLNQGRGKSVRYLFPGRCAARACKYKLPPKNYRVSISDLNLSSFAGAAHDFHSRD
jgi:hypothetical protein